MVVLRGLQMKQMCLRDPCLVHPSFKQHKGERRLLKSKIPGRIKKHVKDSLTGRWKKLASFLTLLSSIVKYWRAEVTKLHTCPS